MTDDRPMLNLLALRSADIHQAVTFYQLLGLEFERHSHNGGPEHYASLGAGVTLEIYPLKATHVPTTSTRLGFCVENVDELVSRLRSAGFSVISPPTDSEWGRRAVLKDYDGHSVELLTL